MKISGIAFGLAVSLGIGTFELSKAQTSWIAAGIPGTSITPQQVYATPDGERIYYCGAFIQDWSQGYASNTVLRYEAGQWHTMGTIPQLVTSVAEYRDTLIATGAFPIVNDSLPVDHVAFWNGEQWLPYGSFQISGARQLRVIDDTLYAVGALDTVDGQDANGVARRIGGHWEPVGTLITDSETIMGDIVKYDGGLVVSGSGSINSEFRIFRYENGTWSILGGGIQGGLCSAQCLAVYQGELYVGGQITMACGNPGQGILRWDGSTWQPVGLGLQYALGDFSSFAGPTTMVEHDGLLYIGGGFRYAGGIEAFGIATWDGAEWCSVPGNFSNGIGHNGVMRMDFYHDTLFVAANMVDEDSVNFACKFIGTSYEGVCTGPLAVPNAIRSRDDVMVIAEPESFHVRLPEGHPVVPVVLMDLSGRVLQLIQGGDVRFPTTNMASGSYIILAKGFQAKRVVLP